MSEAIPAGFTEQFEALVVDAMTKNRIPGLSIAITQGDQLVYTRGFGARHLTANLPATPNTLWGIGSVTKSFTALAFLRLQAQGKLDVHDPVSKHIPEFKVGSKDEPITFNHLLTHSSGLPSLLVAEFVIARMASLDERWVPLSSIDDFFLHVNKEGASQQAFKPGKRFFYNNTGYILVGEAIRRISKTPYEKYIQKHVLTPMQMKRSTFLKTVFEKDADKMTPYMVTAKEGKVIATPAIPPFHPLVYAPGGLLTSVSELANYLQIYFNDGTFQDSPLLKPELLQQMLTPHIPFFSAAFKRVGYGYGWSIIDDFLGDTRLVSHGGSTGLSSAFLAFLPKHQLGIAGAANVGAFPAEVIHGAFALLTGKDPKKTVLFYANDSVLNQLKGVYETQTGYLRVEITKRGGLLFATSKDPLFAQGWGAGVPLVPVSDKADERKFYIYGLPGSKLQVEFKVAKSGHIDLFVERYHLRKIGPTIAPP